MSEFVKKARHPLALLLGFGLLLRLAAALFSHGFHHIDEVFQVLEPAHGLVYGPWVQVWEWEKGIRSWFLPGLFAGQLEILKLTGIQSPDTVLVIIRVLLALISLFGIWGAYRLAELYGGRKAAILAGGLMAFWWMPVYFSVRTLSETLALYPIVIAHVWVLTTLHDSREIPPKRSPGLLIFGAGLLCGLAFMIRFQTGIFSVALGLTLLLMRRRKWFFIFSCGVLLLVITQGVLDLLTWGSFLHSPIEYFRFNVVEGGAAKNFGTHHWYRYLVEYSWFFTLPGLILFLAALLKTPRNTWPLWLSLAFFVGMHQAIGHKEGRFLYPALPIFFVLVSVGALRWKTILKPAPFSLLAALIILGGLYKYATHRWNRDGALEKSFTELHAATDLQGVVTVDQALLGSYFYLHRNVPLANPRRAAEVPYEEIPARLNYLFLPSESGTVLTELKKRGVSCDLATDRELPLYRCEKKS